MPKSVEAESKTALIAAMLGNIAIAVTKFIAAAFTGSSAMISEGIHSVVDTGNGGLILLGIRKSRQPPDFEHPFGHGKELYFWSLIVALAIFAVGCGTSVYEGLRHLLYPRQIEHPIWNYAVLSFAMIFEGSSWFFGWKAFQKAKGKWGLLEGIRRSKDPASFMVLFEDSAAMLGLIIAFVGVLIGHQFRNIYADGLASILIGLVLGLVSFFLAYKSKGLLIGEGVEPDVLRNIQKLVDADHSVEHSSCLLTMHFGPHEVMLTLQVKFRDELSAVEVREAVNRLQQTVQKAHPDITRMFFASESVGYSQSQVVAAD